MKSRALLLIFVFVLIFTGLNTYVIERVEYKLTDWDILWMAIAEKESNTNDSAKNKKSTAIGRYQILKCTVDEANRISKHNKFTYDDRFNAYKAFQIIEAVQLHHNPTKCHNKAIRIHSIGFTKDPKMLRYFENYKTSVETLILKIKDER